MVLIWILIYLVASLIGQDWINVIDDPAWLVALILAAWLEQD